MANIVNELWGYLTNPTFKVLIIIDNTRIGIWPDSTYKADDQQILVH